MPIPAALAPAVVSAGGSLVSSLANAAFTSGANKKSRQFAREMYGRQKDDNIAFWNMQNAYNDPAAQMQRLKNAGLRS